MKMFDSKIFVTVALFCTNVYVAESAYPQFDYHWRDYTGDIPDDAVPGGLDRNNQSTYIGQLLLMKGDRQQGLQPVRIYAGQKEVTASRYGIITSDKFVKILCSLKPESFKWEEANSENLHLTTIGKHLVQAGAEEDQILSVGRTQYQGELIVGKVCSGNIGNALLFFPHDDKEHYVQTYQVLVYKEHVSKIDFDKYWAAKRHL